MISYNYLYQSCEYSCMQYQECTGSEAVLNLCVLFFTLHYRSLPLPRCLLGNSETLKSQENSLSKQELAQCAIW